MDFTTTAAFALALIAAWIWKAYNNWRQLSHIPGPLFASLTDFWRAWQHRNGKLQATLNELHKQHGPFVRYGVRSVSVSDPKIVDVVYGTRPGFIIADSYKVLAGISNGKDVHSLVTTADENRHKILRRSVAGTFSSNASLDYEPHIDRSIEDLLKVLRRDRVVIVSDTFAYYTMDAAGRFSFGHSLGCLAANDDAGGRIALVRERSNHWAKWGSLPGLERLIYRNPIAMRMKRAPSSMATQALQLLREREEKPPSPSETPDLMTRFLEASKGQPETLNTPAMVGLLMSTISGAGDTTATALTAIIYFLLKNPTTFAKLEEEITSSDLRKPIPAFGQVSKLPYLHAVMREAMRLFPVATMPLERKVPAGGVSIAGTFFPEGISIGCMQSALHHNPEVFGGDADLFRPERWLEADAERLKAMEVAHMGFSRGRRVCIGLHIAVMQIKKVIPALIMEFKITLADPNAEIYGHFTGALSSPKPFRVIFEKRE